MRTFASRSFVDCDNTGISDILKVPGACVVLKVGVCKFPSLASRKYFGDVISAIILVREAGKEFINFSK